jgi:hypothetical protein
MECKREWVRSSNSFVFSLVNAVGGPARLRCSQPEYAIECHPSWGPVFGGGDDIGIVGDWTRAGCSCKPYSYTTCDPAFALTPVTNLLLAGSKYNLSVGELEVFALEASVGARRAAEGAGEAGEEVLGTIYRW